MNRIRPVTLDEFKLLIEYAQTHHSNLNEPIPQISESKYEKVNSCLETPFQTFGGKYLYPGFYPKAAILFYLLNKNHALTNGNKRMACITLGFFCFKNKYDLQFSWESFYEISKEVTNSDPAKMEVMVLALQDTFKKFIPKLK